MTMNPAGSGGDAPILARIAFEYISPGDGAQAPGGSVNPEMIGQGADARAKSRRTEKREDKNEDNVDKTRKILTNHLRSTLGINLGISAILKQSQIFTGTLGAVFQILGAMVDVILASFMPIIVPALKLLVKMIPGIKAASDRMVGFFMWIIRFLHDHGGFLKRFFDSKLGSLLKGLFQYFIVTLFIARLLGAHKLLWTLIKLGWTLIVGGLKALLLPLFGVQRNTAVMAARSAGGGMGMHPGGGGAAGSVARGGGAAARGRGMMKMGPMGMGGMAFGASMLAMSGGASYAIGGMGAGGLGGSLGGMAVGGALGFALGGPAGAMIGANIGAIAGPIIGSYLDKTFSSGEGTRVRDNHNKLGDRDIMRQNNNPDWLAQYDREQRFKAAASSGGPVV